MSTRRLDSVLRVRTIREQIARGEVARKRAELDARWDDEARAVAAIRAVDRASALAAPLFLARRAMLASGAQDAKIARAANAVAQEELDAAAGHWRVVAQRLDGIERLVDRLRAEADLDDQRRSANEIDDLVIARRSPHHRQEHVA